MTSYASDPAWADIEPLPQDDGGPHPLAAIAYKDEYSEAMSYLRAVMAKNEMSERVLGLTERIIGMNPAHYTVWLYRSRVLAALSYDLRTELAWLNPTALKHLKNYQIWHHRQTIVDALDSADGEQAFIAGMMEQDAKNYHVWSYRQWLVKRFALWDAGELEIVEAMLQHDVRNNSAWNHRYFLVFGRDDGVVVEQKTIDREIEYAKETIRKAPQNQAPWNYVRGVLRYAKLSPASLKEFAAGFAPVERPEDIKSSHALDLLAEIYAQEQGKSEEAVRVLDLLAEKYDPIRANYWNFRKSQLGSASAAA
ncbi:protein prenylyltransferase [Mytilinidion resinicola]|uniref:Protein farnesyltransferase/geranylgeranyltransferase type-1 subunit alpha n=1 Tax=Mytilinidion resinicola TaxID=574789 RepID=A0A6A6YLX9_9PEZI|nr:protein prenylyltransferase [Mytilinidion resinicola]KAF2809882.1 protein prenylyltransferase [Mytilinidion resinicola]